MSETLTMKKVVTHPYFSMLCFIALCFILPRYSEIATMVVCAGVLSILVAVSPDQFRMRSGSMVAALSLVAAMWIVAAVIIALRLIA